MIPAELRCLLGESKPLPVPGIAKGTNVIIHYFQRFVSTRFLREFDKLSQEGLDGEESAEVLRGLVLNITDKIEVNGKFFEPTLELLDTVPSESLSDILTQIMVDSRPKASGAETSPDALPPKDDSMKSTRSTPTLKSRSGSGSRRGSSTTKRRPGKSTP